MTRQWVLLALLVSLIAVGYERFMGSNPEVAPAPPGQEETFRSAEGGDGTPPPPCVKNCP